MAPPQQSRSLVSGFLRSLLANPGSPALELGELSLSYEQLWDYAGKITARLNDTLDPSEKVVAVLANRSVAAYGGILGVLASGCGYVPLNPKFPLERTRCGEMLFVSHPGSGESGESEMISVSGVFTRGSNDSSVAAHSCPTTRVLHPDAFSMTSVLSSGNLGLRGT